MPTGRWRTAVLLGLLAFAGLGLVALWLTPDATLVGWGERIRRANDVTPERISRYRQLTLGAAVGLLGLAAWSFVQRAHVRAFFASVDAELRGLPAEISASIRKVDGRTWLAFALLFAISAALRLYYLNTPMAYDEAYSFTNFARRPLVEALADYNNTNNHLLNTFCMHVTNRLFGQQDWALRLPVLIAGLCLVAIAYPWARLRIGATPALLVAAFVGGSPMLIDYAVNARGYEFLTVYALTFDLCCVRIATRRPGEPTGATWLLAGAAVAKGFWAMPIMVYPFVGVAGWFALAPLFEKRSLWPRVRGLLWMSACAGIAVAALYAPAYVFRGLHAAGNAFVQPLTFGEWLAKYPTAWAEGAERWTAGPLRGEAWLAFFLLGAEAWRRRWKTPGARSWGTFALLWMFVATAVMMAGHRLAPPPRLFLFLAPWFYLIAATGVAFLIGAVQSIRPKLGGDTIVRFLSYAFLTGSIVYCFERPILREPQQREPGIGSVPAALQSLGRTIEANPGRHRLLVPLPCDHPAIYYANKFGLPVEINGKPRPGERLWMLVRPGMSPADTLNDVVIDLGGAERPTGTWKLAAEFAELKLYELQK